MPKREIAIDGMGNIATVFPHTRIFLSAEQTGSGDEQSVAHGLGVVPSLVGIFATGDARGAWATFSITEGTHTSTYVKATVTTNIKYRILAFG